MAAAPINFSARVGGQRCNSAGEIGSDVAYFLTVQRQCEPKRKRSTTRIAQAIPRPAALICREQIDGRDCHPSRIAVYPIPHINR